MGKKRKEIKGNEKRKNVDESGGGRSHLWVGGGERGIDSCTGNAPDFDLDDKLMVIKTQCALTVHALCCILFDPG